AEDGIRDRNVTGVQTCALPISTKRHASCRARSVPTVVLPEPMKPASETIDTRGRRPREAGVVVTRKKREGLSRAARFELYHCRWRARPSPGPRRRCRTVL